MNKNKKAIDMTPEELNEWLASLPAPKDDLPRLPFSDLDPYFKMEQTPRVLVVVCANMVCIPQYIWGVEMY